MHKISFSIVIRCSRSHSSFQNLFQLGYSIKLSLIPEREECYLAALPRLEGWLPQLEVICTVPQLEGYCSVPVPQLEGWCHHAVPQPEGCHCYAVPQLEGCQYCVVPQL